jgi:palmitoyl transferase
MDSNDHFQPVLGYSHLWYWEIARELSFGLGAAAGFSARYEWYYIPFPAALPLVSLQYKNLAMHATYIPEARNRGNVMFVILRWHFN